jgi:glucan phosphoethanolaminetransferase (alkaline phosphatase superfamily)
MVDKAGYGGAELVTPQRCAIGLRILWICVVICWIWWRDVNVLVDGKLALMKEGILILLLFSFCEWLWYSAYEVAGPKEFVIRLESEAGFGLRRLRYSEGIVV